MKFLVISLWFPISVAIYMSFHMFLLLRSTILEATCRPVEHDSEGEPEKKASEHGLTL